MTNVCAGCSTQFTPSNRSAAYRAVAKFCSRACYAVARQGQLRPSVGAAISAAKRGRTHSAGPKIGDALRGRTLPPETCAKMSASRLGKKHPPERRAKISGPNSWNWKGGLASVNEAIRKGYEYREWRTAVFQRDNYTCQHCGVRGVRLHADHILPFSTHVHLRFELTNGRTLCAPCHKKTPTWGSGAHQFGYA